jgi:hypothetical protein
MSSTQNTDNNNVNNVPVSDVLNDATANLSSEYNKVASAISLQKVDPINSSKSVIYIIFFLGIIIPLILFLVSLKLQTLKPIIIIYVGLFLLGMSIWYLVYSIRQYTTFRNKFKDANIKLNLNLNI